MLAVVRNMKLAIAECVFNVKLAIAGCIFTMKLAIAGCVFTMKLATAGNRNWGVCVCVVGLRVVMLVVFGH